MVAARLLSIINEIQTAIGGMVKNEVIKHIVSKFYHKIMQESLIVELQDLSTELLQDIDAVEQEKLSEELRRDGRDPRLAYVEPSFPRDFTENEGMDIMSESSGSTSTDSTHINFQTL